MAHKMVQIQCLKAMPVVHIDGFPEGIKRTVEGSIKLSPGLVTMSWAEWDHVKKARPDILKHTRVNNIREVDDGADQKAEAAPAVTTGTPTKSEGQESPAPVGSVQEVNVPAGIEPPASVDQAPAEAPAEEEKPKQRRGR